ncbi:class I SAM-dependent methyltransferase [Limnovirga soli]|uniref:Methyltransferase domain-containing protein n=1 Tax=Limnovirga soli TaxID=2656915 RepID=A0A8J8FH04_9BACT|nr:class I SAM-dependent methyltransferase [Limnovirga soli]NNV54909.1 methyltransferase domain-containing protein [Limnovirga soli]
MSNDIVEINRAYYNKSYSAKTVLFGLIHSWISFDQQSKSRKNFEEIQPLIEACTHKPVYYLDYGFGHGSLLLKMPAGVAIYGCDIADEAVRNLNNIAGVLKRNIKVTTVENFDAFVNGVSFNIISCSHVLEHVEDDAALVGIFKKHLHKDGKLVINLPVNEVWNDPKHARKYTPQSATDLLGSHGFVVEKMLQCDRLTAFFLHHEQVKPVAKPFKIMLRAIRLFFAVMPGFFSTMADKWLPAKYEFQQLILVARLHE